MDIDSLIRNHVARIFEAGRQKALAELTNGTVEKYLSPSAHPRIHGKFVKVPEGNAPQWAVPPVEPTAPAAPTGIPLTADADPVNAVLGAMLLHAVECAQSDTDAVPGLKVLVGLIRDRKQLAKVTGQSHAAVEKAYWASVEKVWDDKKHPRDNNGRFIAIGKIEAAITDPAKAKELRRIVDPKDRQKLEAALKGDPEMPNTVKGKKKLAAHRNRLSKQESQDRMARLRAKLAKHGAMKGDLAPSDLHEFAELLPGMRVQDLRALRKEFQKNLVAKVGWGGARKQAHMAERLVGFVHARLATMEGPQPQAPGAQELEPEKDDTVESPEEPDVEPGEEPEVGEKEPDVEEGEDLEAKHAPKEPEEDDATTAVDPKGNSDEAYSPKPAPGVNKDAGAFRPEQAIKIAADDIGSLRKPDVFRVLDWAPAEHRETLAKYITDNRPELANEVKDVMADVGGPSAEPVPEPAPKKGQTELQKRLADHLSGVDADTVKHIHADRKATYDALTESLTGAQKHLEDLEKGKRTATTAAEKRTLNKNILAAEKLIRERQDKRDKYLDDDTHYTNRLEHIGVDESKPDFVRYAALRRGQKHIDPDETYEHILDSVREHLKANGHDPSLAEEVAARVSQSPTQASDDVDRIIGEERTRKGHMTAREDAKKFVRGLGMPPELVAQAEADTGNLWSEDLDKFKKKWASTAEVRQAEKTRREESDKIAKERSEKEQNHRKAADEYMAAVQSGHAIPDAPPEALRDVARRVMNAPSQWHAGVELPNGPTAKSLVDKIGKHGGIGGRINKDTLARTLVDKGWYTDAKHMVKATPDMVEHAKQTGLADAVGKPLPTEDIIKSAANGQPGELVASKFGDSGHHVLVRSEDGKTHYTLDGQYVANILKFYPKAKPLVSEGHKPVLFKQDGEVVGLVMPLNGDEHTKAPDVNPNKRPSLPDVLEKGPYNPEDATETHNGFQVGSGDDAMTVKVTGNASSGFSIPDYSDATYPTRALAHKAARELLAHAHGKDEAGNLVFKPKGQTTELAGPEKQRYELYKELGERVKAHGAKKAETMKWGEGDDATERDVVPITEHFGVSQSVPEKDARGKDKEKSWVLVHTPTGMTVPSHWKKKNDAIGHAMLLQNLPEADWGTVTRDTDKDRMKAIGKRANALKEAYTEEQFHPDMTLPPAEPKAAPAPKKRATRTVVKGYIPRF